MTKVKLLDKNFYEDLSSSKCYTSDLIEWDRSPGSGPVVVFTDYAYSLAKLSMHKKAFRVAWQLEPLEINQAPYNHLIENYGDFDLILSHDEEFLSKIPNGEFLPACMTWIADEDWNMYRGRKTKHISIIASAKNQTTGHKLRHEIIDRFKDYMDVFGYGYNPIDNKVDALREYKYSVIIENSARNDYFTEKLIDCFATGTVPIYWGTEKIYKYFDNDGILQLSLQDPVESFHRLIMALEKDDVYKKADESLALDVNFTEATQYRCQEDFIYEILTRRGLIND